MHALSALPTKQHKNETMYEMKEHPKLNIVYVWLTSEKPTIEEGDCFCSPYVKQIQKDYNTDLSQISPLTRPQLLQSLYVATGSDYTSFLMALERLASWQHSSNIRHLFQDSMAHQEQWAR